MKKLFLLLTLFAVVSCSEEDVPEVKITSYQITNNMDTYESDYEFLDGTLYDVIVFKFIEDDLAGEDQLDAISPDGGTSDVIEIDEQVTKIKVSFKFLPERSEQYDLAERRYLASYTFITKDINNEVEINGNSMIQGTLRSQNTSLKKLFDNIK